MPGRLLVHACCGPCLLYPLAQLRREGFDLQALFYNPNIQPYSEFEKRRETLDRLAGEENLPLIVLDDYPLEDWLRSVAFREAQRCSFCYHLRLERAARLAKKSGFDGFTTTLLYSKQQKHGLIAEIGRSVGREVGVEFVYRDFRPGWRQGQEEAKARGLYRQQYCGCIYSERDRFKPVNKRA